MLRTTFLFSKNWALFSLNPESEFYCDYMRCCRVIFFLAWLKQFKRGHPVTVVVSVIEQYKTATTQWY